MDQPKQPEPVRVGPFGLTRPLPSAASTEPPAAEPKLKYGGMDAEDESILPMLGSVSNARPPSYQPLQGTDNCNYTLQAGPSAEHHNATADPKGSFLVQLPAELLDNILSYLCPLDLTAVSQTCRLLYSRATSEFHWQRWVQAHVPGSPVTTPYPCKSFKDLWAAHDPRWFLPKYKIWFSGQDYVGKLIIVRYDQRRGCIEGYQMLAISERTEHQHWQADPNVIIHSFEPTVKLHLDKPVLHLRCHPPSSNAAMGRDEEIDEESEAAAGEAESSVWERHRQDLRILRPNSPAAGSSKRKSNRFASEISMTHPGNTDGMYSNFRLARPMEEDAVKQGFRLGFPYGDVWPPPAVPALRRIAAANLFRLGRGLHFTRGVVYKRPFRRAEVSDQGFHIRSWMEMRHAIAPRSQVVPGPAAALGLGISELAAPVEGGGEDDEEAEDDVAAAMAAARPRLRHRISLPFGLHIGEETTTYATLDPFLYTPTADCPWRGIWVGDYSGHGCEFLLINQIQDGDLDNLPDDGLTGEHDETDEELKARRRDARVYRGRLEAIKLTGDPNVPRGEYTFVAEDIGPMGFVRVEQDEPFKGARVVRSKGRVAGSGFVGDKFIDSRLLMISHDRLAQHWLDFGHISFFQRVNIDQFLKAN